MQRTPAAVEQTESGLGNTVQQQSVRLGLGEVEPLRCFLSALGKATEQSRVLWRLLCGAAQHVVKCRTDLSQRSL